MGIKVYEIEHDTSATVKNLINTHEQKNLDSPHNKEGRAYQWNNFV